MNVRVSLELDVPNVDVEEMIGEWDTGHGLVDVVLVIVTDDGDSAIIRVNGSAPSVLGWLLNDYCQNEYEQALDLLRNAAVR